MGASASRRSRMLWGLAIGTLALFLLLTFPVTPGSAHGDDFGCGSVDVRVSEEGGYWMQWTPAIAVGPRGTVFAVWSDPRDEPDGANSIYFSRSSDGGHTWSTPNVRVSLFSESHQEDPSIAVDSEGTVYVAWRGGTTSTRLIDVWVAGSTDMGATWSEPSKVNDVSGYVDASTSFGPAIAVDAEGALYVAWMDWRNSLPDNVNPVIADPDIYVARSIDGGLSWSPNVRVNDDVGTTEQIGDPAIAVDPDGAVYIAWQDRRDDERGDVYVSGSDDGGATWSTNVRVNDVTTGFQGDPGLAAGAGGVFVAWLDGRDSAGDIYFSSSQDRGVSWSTNLRINDVQSRGTDSEPSLAVRDHTVYVAWHQDVYDNGLYQALLVRSLDDGVHWGPNLPLAEGTRAELHPVIALDSTGTVFGAWEDERGASMDIYATSCPLADPMAQVVIGPSLGKPAAGMLSTDPRPPARMDDRSGHRTHCHGERPDDPGMTLPATSGLSTDETGSTPDAIVTPAANPSPPCFLTLLLSIVALSAFGLSLLVSRRRRRR